jgi:hypothetical protein
VKLAGRTEYVYALGQLGMSAHFPKNVSELVLGAPGIYSWRGQYIRVMYG